MKSTHAASPATPSAAPTPNRAQRRHPKTDQEPSLLVSVAETQRLLGDITRPTLLKLLEHNELVSLKVQRRRMIVRASIDAYIARQIAAAS